jgi:mRNA-degrading endonuclease RelE of RelBE toxin-antitoxin system
MAKRLVWTDQAKADIRALDQQPALQVLKTLARFLKSGEGNTKQLRGYDPPLFRLRAQDYRVFFRDKGEYC